MHIIHTSVLKHIYVDITYMNNINITVGLHNNIQKVRKTEMAKVFPIQKITELLRGMVK